ncbi:multiple sugar transport system permease protein [Rhizobium sp. BK313]|jgi:multiple sugar transport system permease protein|uniref:carbohydrate ABC transporter permease n=1 Tax=Rhizobium sp. BK313 TaxID=2587081 RepID=UPI00105B360C|nr:carbohydrate ABC transporter permease [Rhizobium sp. BK313]MBB3451982.1 multiple sugar transport system permease protein [Rhizobium sp. BK313]
MASLAANPVRMRRKRRDKRWLLHVVLIAGAFLMLYPLLWMIGSSFKPEGEIFSNLNPIPTSLDFSNYIKGWTLGTGASFSTFFLNSFIVCVGAIVGNLLSCSLAAYAFARINFRFKGILFALMIGTLMLPFHVTVVPQYIIFNSLGWINTFLPLIVPKFFAVDAFFIFLMVQFIRGIPLELEQAAKVDGCNRFQIFTLIILPLMMPALVTTTIFTFIWTWNDFFSQLLYLNAEKNYTVSLGLRQFLDASGQSSWGSMFAMTTLSLVPVFLVFLFFQKRLVEGIATTGLKG